MEGTVLSEHKGSGGWTKSPIGPTSLESHIPDEDGQNSDVDELEAAGKIDEGRDIEAIPLSDQADVEQEANSWASLWDEGKKYNAVVQPGGTPPPEALVVGTVIAAALRLPIHTGLGSDNSSPRAFTRLPRPTIEALCRLLMAVEVLGRWPQLLQLVLIALLPKPDGGRRPIGLFPTIIRLWMRSRSEIARRWEAANYRPGVFGGAGIGAQRAAWQTAFRAEKANLTNKSYAQSLLDLVKAFERIPHDKLIVAAKKHRYCLWILRLTLQAYRSPRAIGIVGVFSRQIVANCGITAGSGAATTELKLLLLDVIDDTYIIWPMVQISVYVDDFSIDAEGDEGYVECMVAGATDRYSHHPYGRHPWTSGIGDKVWRSCL